jgi:D-glycero-alpha-D-manno-heptose-7-phosphate kinase
MITVQCPLRVSLFGGGSDYVDFSRLSPGVVVGGTINKYLYVNINPMSAFARERFRLTYRITESVMEIDEIQHPIVRTMLNDLKWSEPINIATMADIPGQTGLGSSSAFTVAMRAGLAAYTGEQFSAKDLSDYTLRIERVLLSEPGGIQDQLYPAFGGLRRFDIVGWSYSPSVPLLDGVELDQYSAHLMLVFTGSVRQSQTPAAQTREALRDARRMEDVRQITSIANAAAKGIAGATSAYEAVETTEWVLRESWALKSKLDPSIAPPAVTGAIERGLGVGARAAKLLGSGGSGFVLFVVDPDRRQQLTDAFPPGYALPFKFVNDSVTVHDSLSPSHRALRPRHG